MRWVCLLVLSLLAAAELSAREFTVLVYNVENLTAADGKTVSDDYHPARYSRAHLLTKMNHIAEIAARFENGIGPDIILFQEVERDFSADQYVFDHAGMLRRFSDTRIEDMLGVDFNREVAKLPVEALLLKTFADRGLTGYRVAAADDTPLKDARRVVTHLNVIFTRFPIGSVRTYPIPGAPAMLEVQVEVEGHPLYLFNNHWKAGAADEKAENARVEAAKELRERIDEIVGVNPNTDVIVAGDFNSFYDQKQRFRWEKTALNDTLAVKNDARVLRSRGGDLYNLWNDLPVAERGTELYQGTWATFMQMILSRGLYDYRGVQYVEGSFGIAAFPDLNMTENGEPFRWSFRGTGAGYSSHFPIYARFVTVPNNRTDQYLQLTATRNGRGGVQTSEHVMR